MAGLLVALCLPAAAQGATRQASPFSVDTTGTCIVTACRLDRALAVAQAGDEVTLEDGTYVVTYQAQANTPVAIRPAIPGTRPWLVGAAGLAFPTLDLTAGGSVSNLRIETSAATGLQLAGGAKGYGLEIHAAATNANAVAAFLKSAPSTTALVNSVARTLSSSTAVEIVDGSPAGAASLVNVTAVATGASSWGVTTEMFGQSPVLKNSIVRSTAKALHGRSGSQPILTSTTNFVTSGAANWTDGPGNQKDVAVTFLDQAAGNLRPVAGSATIDAGAADALTSGTIDPAGTPRVVGAAQDIGAFEHLSAADVGTGTGGDAGTSSGTVTTPGVGTGTGTGAGTITGGTATAPAPVTPSPRAADGDLPPAAAPVAGERVTVEAAKGTPRVRLPGTQRFVDLDDASGIPVGSTIDATTGHVNLTSVRDAQGRTQTGEFWGGVFTVRQSGGKDAYTELVLSGSSFAGCPAVRKSRAKGAVARAAAKRRKAKAAVRSLWGSDSRGRFRTRGRDSVATVRGTVWFVQDRCDGTLTRVKEGAVQVRDARGRQTLVRVGGSHLAKHR